MLTSASGFREKPGFPTATAITVLTFLFIFYRRLFDTVFRAICAHFGRTIGRLIILFSSFTLARLAPPVTGLQTGLACCLRMPFAVALCGLILGDLRPARAEPAFAAGASEQCVAEALVRSPSRSDHGVLDCVGRAARACFARPGGDSTVGMMECLTGELGYWDRRLNVAYAQRMRQARSLDNEMASLRASASSQADGLRDMQRAWIPFRDASCRFEQSLWMGGTGGGPATLSCLMHETARQALRLEGWWAQ